MPLPAHETLTEELLLEVLTARMEQTYEDPSQRVEAIAQRFIGQSVSVHPVTEDAQPITAYCYASPYPAFGNRGYRPQSGLLLREHPRRARGTIERINTEEGKLTIKPRITSLYRADRGYFVVDMFNDNGEALVKVDLL